MKNKIRQWIISLGFVTQSSFQHQHTDIRRLNERIDSLQETVNDLNIQVNEFEFTFRNCLENNHRLKKLEEYLEIEYTVEQPKTFIGYKKK